MLTETPTLPGEDAPAIPGCACYFSSREYKHPRAVRGSGGIAFYVRSSIVHRLLTLEKVPLHGSIGLNQEQAEVVAQTVGCLLCIFSLDIGLVYNVPHSNDLKL